MLFSDVVNGKKILVINRKKRAQRSHNLLPSFSLSLSLSLII